MALFLVLLLSIESFAATVGDNDGAAFITKAEFDSLKNTFQAQIDQYNSSIDNKIDGAIASYLAGIKTTRTLQLKNLVSNYNNMVWKRKFDVYGTYVDWTSFTASTKKENQWFEPKWEERQVIREPGHQFGICQTVTFAYLSGLALGGQIYPQNSQSENLISNNYNTNNPEVWVLRCDYDSDDPITLYNLSNPFYKVTSNNNYMTSQPNSGYSNYGNAWTYSIDGSSWTGIGSQSGFMHSWKPIDPAATSLNWLENGTPGSTDIINLYTTVRTNGIGYVSYLKQHHKLDANRFGVLSPLTHSIDSMSDINITAWANQDNQNPKIFQNMGGHIYAQAMTTNASQQWGQVRYFMYGDDSTLTVNILRQHPTMRIGSVPAYKTTHSRFASLLWTVDSLYCNTDNYHRDGWESISDGRSYDPVAVTLKRPYFERYQLAKITSGDFKNGEYKLKMGDGLPISTGLSFSGNLKITFDYTINRLVGSVPSTANKIKVDVKKTSFLSGTNDYYTGTVDGGTAKQLKNVSSNDAVATKGKKTTIEIENVKEGDGVWLRLAPLATDLGLYAQISNLKVFLETEG